MKSAVIIGGNGLIGRALVNELVENDIPVVILGTSNNISSDLRKSVNALVDYCQVQQKSNWIENIVKRLVIIVESKILL